MEMGRFPSGQRGQTVNLLAMPSVVRIPARSSDAQIAQLVEQRTENPRVVGSIPTLGTQHLSLTDGCFFIVRFTSL